MENKQKLVANIGGVFIYSRNPKELAEWYVKHLGIEFVYTEENKNYVAVFNYKDIDSDKQAYFVWSILDGKNRPDYEGKVFTVNYRVNNMDEVLAHLKSLGAEVKGPETHEGQGIFAWINDPDGNNIELWQDTEMK